MYVRMSVCMLLCIYVDTNVGTHVCRYVRTDVCM